ncbi:MAG: hypothetical protein WBX25_28560 [Rhodomicrobium sp.]
MMQEPATIKVAARELSQLFNSLDPSPFPERDLDDEAETYIVSWAKELSPSGRFCIAIHLPRSEIIKAEQRGLRKSISHYFTYRSEMLARSERECLRKGRRFLFAGILVLALCSTAAQALIAVTNSSPIAQLAADGLMIFGWVANWRPAEIFLYEFWEIKRTRRLYQRLAEAEIALVARDEDLLNAGPGSPA